MKLAVVGSDKFSNFVILMRVLNLIRIKAGYMIEEIVTQGEITKDSKDPSVIYGVSEFAKKYAKTMMYPYKQFFIEWEDSDGNYNSSAAFERNQKLVDYADVFVIFHDRDSNSLKLLEEIQKSGKNVYEFDFKKTNLEL